MKDFAAFLKANKEKIYSSAEQNTQDSGVFQTAFAAYSNTVVILFQ